MELFCHLLWRVTSLACQGLCTWDQQAPRSLTLGVNIAEVLIFDFRWSELLGSTARVEANLWTFHHITQNENSDRNMHEGFYFYCLSRFEASISKHDRTYGCVDRKVSFFASFRDAFQRSCDNVQFGEGMHSSAGGRSRARACKKSRFVNKTSGEEENDVKLRNCSSKVLSYSRVGAAWYVNKVGKSFKNKNLEIFYYSSSRVVS